MLALIAQATGPATTPAERGGLQGLLDTLVHVFSSPDTLAQPANLTGSLVNLSVVWAVVFIIAGVLCMLSGYRFYKVAVVIVALMMGLLVGHWLGARIGAPQMIVAGCLGLLLAVCAFPLMKYAVAVLGGLSGAFLGANLWAGVTEAINRAAETSLPVDAYYVGALVGLIVCGMLAFILFELTIVLFTSVSGATLAVLGGLALLMSFDSGREFARGLETSRLVIPLMVLVPAVIGLILQETWAHDSGGGKPAGGKA